MDLTRHVTIINELGLHARAAGKIALIAQKAKAGVLLENDGRSADATSIIDILTLACSRGTQIALTIEDPADLDILDQIEALVNQGFGE